MAAEEEEKTKESQVVWCFPLTTWGVLIAKSSIVWFAINSFSFLMILASCLTRGENKVMKSIQQSDNMIIAAYQDSSFKTVIWLLILFMILTLVGFFMAFILLKGVQKRNPQRLWYWFVYTGVALGIQVLWVISIVESSNVPAVLLWIVGSVTFVSFAMSLVYTLKLEMEAENAEEADADADADVEKGEVKVDRDGEDGKAKVDSPVVTTGDNETKKDGDLPEQLVQSVENEKEDA